MGLEAVLPPGMNKATAGNGLLRVFIIPLCTRVAPGVNWGT